MVSTKQLRQEPDRKKVRSEQEERETAKVNYNLRKFVEKETRGTCGSQRMEAEGRGRCF